MENIMKTRLEKQLEAACKKVTALQFFANEKSGQFQVDYMTAISQTFKKYGLSCEDPFLNTHVDYSTFDEEKWIFKAHLVVEGLKELSPAKKNDLENALTCYGLNVEVILHGILRIYYK